MDIHNIVILAEGKECAWRFRSHPVLHRILFLEFLAVAYKLLARTLVVIEIDYRINQHGKIRPGSFIHIHI